MDNIIRDRVNQILREKIAMGAGEGYRRKKQVYRHKQRAGEGVRGISKHHILKDANGNPVLSPKGRAVRLSVDPEIASVQKEHLVTATIARKMVPRKARAPAERKLRRPPARRGPRKIDMSAALPIPRVSKARAIKGLDKEDLRLARAELDDLYNNRLGRKNYSMPELETDLACAKRYWKSKACKERKERFDDMNDIEDLNTIGQHLRHHKRGLGPYVGRGEGGSSKAQIHARAIFKRRAKQAMKLMHEGYSKKAAWKIAKRGEGVVMY